MTPLTGSQSASRHVSGTTWDVYLCILTAREPVGVREVWRALDLSSPSLAQYHINKLLELNMLKQSRNGKYAVDTKEQVETLRSFVLLRGRLIPRLVFYGCLVAGILGAYILLRGLRLNLQDLVVLAISLVSIVAFFFEAFNQRRSLRAAVQRV